MSNGPIIITSNETIRSVPAVEPVERGSGTFLATMALSLLTGLLLLGSLIYLASPWNILANTRLLNLFIEAGLIKYHDRDAGFVEGVAQHVYYLKAQDPIVWMLVPGILGIYLLIAGLKAVQFHQIAQFYGIRGSLGQHARAFFYGLIYKETLPFHLGEVAVAAELNAEGIPLKQSRATLSLFNAFFLFEVAVFALFGLLGIGWAAWLFQLFCALIIIGTLYLWTHSEKSSPFASLPRAIGSHFMGLAQQEPLRLFNLSLLSLLAFGLRDAAAYLTAMAFSSEFVLLNIDPSLILMGVLGGYIASFIRLTPGGIGQFEWGFATALFIGGVGLPEAATAAILVNFFRYIALFVLFIIMLLWHSAKTNFRAVLQVAQAREWQEPVAVTPENGQVAEILTISAQAMPEPSKLWSRALIVAWIVTGIFFFDQLAKLLADMWLLESLQLSGVFWTNFSMGAVLFVITWLCFSLGLALPAWLHPVSSAVRRFVTATAGLVGLLAGYLLSMQYHDFLLLFNGQAFGQADPVFGRDIGFYVFSLPAMWKVWQAAAWLFGLSLISAVVCASIARPGRRESFLVNRARVWLGSISTPATLVMLIGSGVTAAVGVWLSRFELLFKENKLASVFTGAAHLDVSGLFSVLNQIQVSAVIVLGVTAALVVILAALNRAVTRPQSENWRRPVRLAGWVACGLIAFDFAFAGAVALRDMTQVTPNQPVIQLEYIRRHIEATRAAYGLNDIEKVDLLPVSNDAPLPEFERLIASPTIRNAPLWPTTVSYLEQLLDPQHAQRIIQTKGDNMVYGPTLEIFRQQQQLRTYYDFLSVAPLRFEVDGELQVVAGAVRELPILEPQPWLAWWGQRFMLYTHGHGMVMAPVAQTNPQGEPIFVSSQIPVQTQWPELAADNQQVYYGLGSANMAISNVRDVKEFDYPTEQGRAENTLPLDAPVGVPVNSLLKRIVFGWHSGEFFELVFSELITGDTRVHYYRQPLKRLERIAPFLYFDNNPYASVVDGQIMWLVNALTTSNYYPYSQREFIGDKSISRTPVPVETRPMNYVEDSVKATMNAATGQVQLYKIKDAPVINTWAAIYPDLFVDGVAMPEGVRQQLTYPVHLFHTQFDDIYIYYQMDDPMYFFNMEDMWDDSDEVLGPLLDQGKAITFSIEPYYSVLETGGLLPATETGTQFAMAMAFTPEGARNLRAIPIAYQDGEDYGRLVLLQVPKGQYIMGPEQADAIIDQDPDISQQISWWNRRGTEVIRGYTTPLLIDGEVLYVEPIFIRSQQNSITQLKRVVLVFRGQAYMAETLEGALRLVTGSQPEINPQIAASYRGN